MVKCRITIQYGLIIRKGLVEDNIFSRLCLTKLNYYCLISTIRSFLNTTHRRSALKKNPKSSAGILRRSVIAHQSAKRPINPGLRSLRQLTAFVDETAWMAASFFPQKAGRVQLTAEEVAEESDLRLILCPPSD